LYVSSVSVSRCGSRTVHRFLNMCTVQPSRPFVEINDTVCCIHTTRPPEDEHNTAQNM